MIEKQKTKSRQWQDNDNKTSQKQEQKPQVFDKSHVPGVSTSSVICLSFVCHVFVMFHCFPLCLHASSVWCVMFNCVFPILVFLFICFLHFLLVFVTFPWISSLFGCFFLVGVLHVFIVFSIVSNVFFIFSLVLIDFSMVLLLSC